MPGVSAARTPALVRFFSGDSLGIADPADSRTFFEQLRARLPERGQPAYRDPVVERTRAALRRAGCVPTLDERLARVAGDAVLEASVHAEEALRANREEAELERMHQCAALVQGYVLPYLYLPNGPMVRRAVRELSCVEDDE